MKLLDQDIGAVVFDMDGVLIDSAEVIERAWKEAAQLFNRPITDDDIERHIHGQPGPHTITALFSDLPLDDQRTVQEHVIQVENTAEYSLIPGVRQLIWDLHHAQVVLGIVTSGWQKKIDMVIEQLDATGFFSTVVQRDDVKRGKPFPDPYLLAAKRLKLPPDQLLVFEDAGSGVESAVGAGSSCIGIGEEHLVNQGAFITTPNFNDYSVKIVDAKTVHLCIQENQIEVQRNSS